MSLAPALPSLSSDDLRPWGFILVIIVIILRVPVESLEGVLPGLIALHAAQGDRNAPKPTAGLRP